MLGGFSKDETNRWPDMQLKHKKNQQPTNTAGKIWQRMWLSASLLCWTDKIFQNCSPKHSLWDIDETSDNRSLLGKNINKTTIKRKCGDVFTVTLTQKFFEVPQNPPTPLTYSHSHACWHQRNSIHDCTITVWTNKGQLRLFTVIQRPNFT